MYIVSMNKMIITFFLNLPLHPSNMPLHKYIALKLLFFVDGDPPDT